MFHRVTSGRASIAECNELGVSEQRRRKFYNGRKVSREDAMRRVIVTRVPLQDFYEKEGDDPMDALIEAIDRRRGNE